MLWLCIGKANYKALRRAFMIHVIYPKNYFIIRIISKQNIVSYGLFLFSKSLPEEQTSCHSSFSYGIICGSGSFAVLYSPQVQENIGYLTVINSTISDCPKL